MASMRPRPRRRLQTTSYKEMLQSDSEDTEPTSSDSDLTEGFDNADSRLLEEDPPSIPEIVRLPDAREILGTQELIHTRAAELAVIDMEYQIAKRTFDVVQAKRTAIEQELLEKRAYLARVRALPQEVLGLVFLFYTDDPSQSPWTLMQVTRRWRATALSTGAMWAKILITSPAWKDAGCSRRKGGKELCGSKEQLDRALRRAGHAALDITISLTNPHKDKANRNYDLTAMRDMIDLLTSSHSRLQVRHFEINGRGTSMLRWSAHKDLLVFPDLESLIISSYLNTDVVAKFLESSKKLTYVHMVLVANDISVYIKDTTHYPNFTMLSLDGRHCDYRGMENARRALNDARLTTLKLSRFYSERRDAIPSVIRLPNLHALVLDIKPCVWAFDAPSLTNLTLSSGGSLPPGSPGSNYFPLLASLIITSTRSSRLSERGHLNNFRFPLCTLWSYHLRADSPS